MAAPTTCAPCDCDPTALALSKDTYQAAQLQILCGILAASGGGGGGGNVVVTNAAGASAVNIQDGGNSITVDGALTFSGAIPAGNNNIGDVDVASVTGNVTVVQPTGTNLHAVLDTGSTTAVTQATGTNLHTVVDSGAVTVSGTATVSQATGTNLHTVVDSGTITTVSAVTAISNALPAGTNLMGKVGIDQTTLGTTNGVSNVASTTGGYTPTRTSLSTTVTALKSSAQGKLGGWSIYNPNSVVAFVQVFNVATTGAVTLGTTVPTMTFPIPPFGAAIAGEGGAGIDFSAGIQIAATTTATGSTPPTTNLETSFWWK